MPRCLRTAMPVDISPAFLARIVTRPESIQVVVLVKTEYVPMISLHAVSGPNPNGMIFLMSDTVHKAVTNKSPVLLGMLQFHHLEFQIVEEWAQSGLKVKDIET